MSEEMKNMNDINDQQTADQTEQDAFSEEIKRRLAEPDSGKPTLEEFKVMVYKDREKRRKKRNTMVACVVAAFVVGLFSFEYFVPEVGADKNPKETIQTEDGVIIEDGGWGSSTGEDDVWVTQEWEDINKIKETFPKLITPSYVPQEYVFKTLKIETVVKTDFTVEYIFIKNESQFIEIEMFFTDNNNVSVEVNDVVKKIKSEKGDVFIATNGMATIQIDDGTIIHIWSDITENELIKLINSLEG